MKCIGLNVCQEDNLKYYKQIFTNEIIDNTINNLCEISSTLIDSTILSTTYIESIHSVRICIESKVKIVYTTQNSEDLYSFEKVIPSVEYIVIDKYIDGTKVNNVFVQTKIKPMLYTDNIFCTIIDNNSILLTYHNVVNLKVSPSFYLSYYIENGLSNNIFISYSNGNNLTQKTFDNFFSYSDVIFDSSTLKLVFIGHIKDQSMIYYTDTKSKNQSKVSCINNFRSIESFCIYSKNKILISLSNDLNLYTYDLNKKEVSKLKTPSITNDFSKIKYDFKSNKIYFIYHTNEGNFLASLGKNSYLEILLKENVIDYVISAFSNVMLIKSTADGKDILSILYLDCNVSHLLSIDFNYDEIIKYDVLLEDEDESILILYKYDNHNYLVKYNLATMRYCYLYASYHINDFDIDKNTYDVLVSLKDDGIFKVLKFSETEELIIFQTSNNIKNIFIKK